MAFLYGDSTPSPLESNFLELLRDALDFSVALLRADENIQALLKRKQAEARAADEETERLGAFGAVVTAAIQDAPKGPADSETGRCAATLATATMENVSASVATVRASLAERIALADSEEASEREASFMALLALLLPHAPPGANVTTRVERSATGTYAANVNGEAFGLTWHIELGIPDGHPFTSPLPIERLAQQVEINAPSPAGWLKKELKLRPQRLERLVLTEVVDDGKLVTLRVRDDVGSEQGFDFDVDPRTGVVSAMRTGKEGPTSGPFDLSAEDTPKVVSLAEKMRAAIGELKGGRLAEATFEGGDFRAQPAFEDVVARLVTVLAPIVQEIARHSLTPTELVIRRLLSNERREEIFVAKATLREKYAHLRTAQRTLFDPLGLEPEAPPAPPEARVSRSATLPPPAARLELPRSEPPPPRFSSAPPAYSSAPPVDYASEIPGPPALPEGTEPQED